VGEPLRPLSQHLGDPFAGLGALGLHGRLHAPPQIVGEHAWAGS
jgi:hypothetical protein